MLSNTDIEKNIPIPPFSVILTERSGGRISALHRKKRTSGGRIVAFVQSRLEDGISRETS